MKSCKKIRYEWDLNLTLILSDLYIIRERKSIINAIAKMYQCALCCWLYLFYTFFYNIPSHSHCDKSREQGCTVLHSHSVHILPNIRPHTCCSRILQSTCMCKCLPQNVVGRDAYFISILCNLFIY